MPWGMKTTAMKQILTDKIREHIEFKETEMNAKGAPARDIFEQL